VLADQSRVGRGLRGRRSDLPAVGVNGEQGEQGAAGERGDSGQRGVAGERGPKGDHGQHGERGATGLRGATNRLAMIGYLILAGLVALGFYRQEQQADLFCKVQNENRAALRASLIADRDRTRTSKQRTPAEKREAEVFYADALARIPPDPCNPNDGAIP